MVSQNFKGKILSRFWLQNLWLLGKKPKIPDFTLQNFSKQFQTLGQHSSNIFLDLNNIDEDSGEKIVVCNAHMHWDPEFSDVKMIQSFLLTTELDRITRQHSTNPQKMPGKLSVW